MKCKTVSEFLRVFGKTAKNLKLINVSIHIGKTLMFTKDSHIPLDYGRKTELQPELSRTISK